MLWEVVDVVEVELEVPLINNIETRAKILYVLRTKKKFDLKNVKNLKYIKVAI